MPVICRFPSGGDGGSSLVEITFTVEGAKGDNITITDASGGICGNVIFDTDATSKEYTMMILDGAEYTFTSSVAKDTETGEGDYSRIVNLSKSSDIVKVMPDSAIYWYGDELIPMASTGASGSSISPVAPTITKNESNITVSMNDTGRGSYRTSDSINLSSYSKIKILASYAILPWYLRAASIRLEVAESFTGNFYATSHICYENKIDADTIVELDVSQESDSFYIGILMQNEITGDCKVTYKAIWLE